MSHLTLSHIINTSGFWAVSPKAVAAYSCQNIVNHSELCCKRSIYTYLIFLVEESNVIYANKVVSFPIHSKPHFVLPCLNSL